MNSTWDEWADYYAEEDLSIQCMEIGDYIETLAPRGSRVVDLGCGTGALAVHLSSRGYKTFGVDSSRAILNRARSASTVPDESLGNAPKWILGDMTEVTFDKPIDVAISIRSTLFSLTTIEKQLRFYANVARWLSEDGYLVTESYVPYDTFLYPAKGLEVARITSTGVILHASAVNLLTQAVTAQRISLTKDGSCEMRTIRQRYIWPAEQRLMARFAGLKHVAEWEDWRRTPTSNKSMRTIQVYKKASHGTY